MSDKRVCEDDEALVEAMLVAFHDGGASLGGIDRCRQRMTAALHVAREQLLAQWAKEKLGPLTMEEKQLHASAYVRNYIGIDDVDMIFASRASAPPAPQDAPESEVTRLRSLAAAAYQFVGAINGPRRFLDALSNAAHGEPFDVDGLLPFPRTNEEDGELQPLRKHDAKPAREGDELKRMYEINFEQAQKINQITGERNQFAADLMRILGFDPHNPEHEAISIKEEVALLVAKAEDAQPAERELTRAEWQKVLEAWYKIWSRPRSTGLDALKAAYAEIKRILNEPAVDPRWEAYRAANDRLLALRGNVDRLTPEQWEELRKLMPSQLQENEC